MMRMKGLNPEHWLIERENQDQYVIRHRISGKPRNMYKEVD